MFSLREESLYASENLPPSYQIAEKIMEYLQPELELLKQLAGLGNGKRGGG